jgi:Domain of unknown function (DUF1929)
LMPNGAVWHSGSNRDCNPGLAGRDRTVEIYEPWYFCGPRPVVTGATSRACAGETINIETPHAKKIDEVVLVRCGSFTHAFNPDQRLVSVPFERSKKTGSLLIAMLPNNSAVLIPGYYLLFILTQDHVPSEGRFVHICRSKGRSIRGIDPDWWRRIFMLFEKLRADPGKLERLELDVEGESATDQARKLAELEAAVRRIEAMLCGGSQGGEKPPGGGQEGGGHGGGGHGGHGHGGHGGGHEH